MVVDIVVQVISRVKQFLDLELSFLREANLVFNNSCSFHDDVRVERAIANVHFVSISAQVVEFVNIDAIARVRYNLVHPLTLGLA